MSTKSSNKSPSPFIQLSLDFSGSYPDSFSNGDVVYLRIGSGNGFLRYISSNGYPWTLWLKTLRLERSYLFTNSSAALRYHCGPNHSTYIKMFCACKHQYVHRVVAQYFLNGGQPIPPGMEVDHLDGNPLNNAVSNLEIVTREENYRRRNVKHGYKHMSAHRRKLSREKYNRRMARFRAQRAARLAAQQSSSPSPSSVVPNGTPSSSPSSSTAPPSPSSAVPNGTPSSSAL